MKIKTNTMFRSQKNAPRAMRKKLSIVLLSAALVIACSGAHANPAGAEVVAGSANFELLGNQLNISNSDGTIIDWQNFSISQDEVTRFIQDSASSAVLNRVIGGSVSEILGRLDSNGQVFLINPAGLVVGEGGVIDTAGFVASTLALSNESFQSGRLLFSGGNGQLVNRGLIHVTGSGDIALVSNSIENSGVLRSDNGDILLAAGQQVSLSFADLEGIDFEVQAPEDSVLNVGQVIATGGNIIASAGRISNDGELELVTSPDGRIFLQAKDTLTVSGQITAPAADIVVQGEQVEISDATLSTASTDVNESAGNISLLGTNVGVFAGSQIDASDDQGGGTILIGGEQQGRGSTPTSDFVYLDEGATVSADGGRSGDGGTIIVFAEDSARVHAELSARGGTESGDGGFIETSGLVGLDVTTVPNAGADHGAAGTWLIDPFDLLISNDTTNPEGGFDDSTPGVFSTIATGARITPGLIVEALSMSDVSIDTGITGGEAGNITIDDAIFFMSGNTLTFNAESNIFVNADIVGQFNGMNSGGIVFNSDLGNGGSASTFLSGGVVQAAMVEFNGGGLTIEDNPDGGAVFADMVTVDGGLQLNNANLEIIGPSASIDQLSLTAGVEAGGRLLGQPGGNYDIGSLQVNPGDPSAFAGSALVGGTFTLLGGGEINVVDGMLGSAAAFSVSGDLINQGTLEISNTGAIEIGFDDFMMPGFGSLVNGTNGVINITDSPLIVSNLAIENNGVINVSALGGFVTVIGELQNNGLVNIENGSVLELDSYVSNSAELHLDDGTLGVMNALPTTIGDGSSVTGTGLILTMGEVLLDFGGTISPGNSPGALTIGGDATFFDGSILDIELAGPTQAELDFIQVDGNLILGGMGSQPAATPGVVLNINNLGGYDPDPMAPHNILSVGGVVTQNSAFDQSANGFDTLNVDFVGNELEVVVSVTPPPPPPPPVPDTGKFCEGFVSNTDSFVVPSMDKPRYLQAYNDPVFDGRVIACIVLFTISLLLALALAVCWLRNHRGKWLNLKFSLRLRSVQKGCGVRVWRKGRVSGGKRPALRTVTFHCILARC